jgi:hypothetical protein
LIVPRNAGAGGGKTFGVDPLGSAAVSPAERLAKKPTSRSTKRTSKGRARIGNDDSFGGSPQAQTMADSASGGKKRGKRTKGCLHNGRFDGYSWRVLPLPELAYDPG